MVRDGDGTTLWSGNTEGPGPEGDPYTELYGGECVESRCARAGTASGVEEGDTVDIYYSHANRKPMCLDCQRNMQVAANQTGGTFNAYGNNGQLRTFSPGIDPESIEGSGVLWQRWATHSQLRAWGL
jgi:hypothetical protein